MTRWRVVTGLPEGCRDAGACCCCCCCQRMRVNHEQWSHVPTVEHPLCRVVWRLTATVWWTEQLTGSRCHMDFVALASCSRARPSRPRRDGPAAEGTDGRPTGSYRCTVADKGRQHSEDRRLDAQAHIRSVEWRAYGTNCSVRVCRTLQFGHTRLGQANARTVTVTDVATDKNPSEHSGLRTSWTRTFIEESLIATNKVNKSIN